MNKLIGVKMIALCRTHHLSGLNTVKYCDGNTNAGGRKIGDVTCYDFFNI